LKRILLIILIAALLLGGGSWWWARQSLPALDGEVRLAGLTGPVEVLLDSHGVPHVYARGTEDAWFTAGVLHARDRLWQMELYRRASAGRLSEILGEQTLRIDRRLLTLGLRAAAEAEWRTAPPSVRTALTRYAEGVNAQMTGASGRLRPLEFQLLRLTPAPWTPVDSLAVGRLLAWRLAENHQAEIVRHALAARFGADDAMRLGGAYPSNGPAILDGPAAQTAGTIDVPPQDSAGGARISLAPAARPQTTSSANVVSAATRASGMDLVLPPGLRWLEPTARRGNSNNWVVSGRRTASGRPLLANDPHLQLEFPGVWYEMHLVAADLDVIGVTIPGAPFVIIGHNARVAWGLTNTGADVQDLFIERIDLARQRYFADGQWSPVDVQKVEIPIRGADPEPFEVWRTRHGAIFSEVGLDWEHAPGWLSSSADRTGERRAFSLRWEAGTGELAGAFEAINRAGDWPSFVRAVERFAAPSQNFVYADVDGNIGYIMSGALPVRTSGNGTMPLDGTTVSASWAGRVSPSSLPRRLNPQRGFIASANNLVERPSTTSITHDWALPYRATRLGDTLSSTERIDLPAAAALQNDVTSLAATHLLARLDDVISHARKRNADAAVVSVLGDLRSWDKRVDGRPVVTAFQLFEAALWRRTFVDEMGDVLFNAFYRWAGAERPAGLYAVIDDPASRWFDDIGTLESRETRDDIYLLAAADVAAAMNGQYRSDTSWSELHVARFEHPLSAAAAPLRWLFSRGPIQMVGDGTTIMRVSYDRAAPFDVWEVPSWRQLFDVGDWDNARVVLPAGQSGHPLSPHYFDQNDMWRQGQYRPQPFTRAAVDAARQHRLLFVP
jgi:penicillin amidase